MIISIDEYLNQLKKALAGCSRSTVLNALADAEEYLRDALNSARAAQPGISEADALPPIIEKYGMPEEVAEGYRDNESRPQFERPRIIAGLGRTITKEFPITDFTSVEVGSAFEVEITQSSSYAVSVTADENMFSYIDVSRSGSTLRISLQRWFTMMGGRTLKASISMPELWGLKLSGAVRANVRGFRSSHDFSATLSGASRLGIDLESGDVRFDMSGASTAAGHLKAANASIELSGASRIQLEGSGENANLCGSGASKIALAEFPLHDVNITLSGASRGDVNMAGRLDVILRGASSLEYSGNPTIGKCSVTGGSAFRRR